MLSAVVQGLDLVRKVMAAVARRSWPWLAPCIQTLRQVMAAVAASSSSAHLDASPAVVKPAGPLDVVDAYNSAVQRDASVSLVCARIASGSQHDPVSFRLH